MHHPRRRSIQPALMTPSGMWWRASSVMTLLGGLWLVASRWAIETSAGAAVRRNGIVAGAAVAVVASVGLVNWRVGP